jgi:hypothetical protein
MPITIKPLESIDESYLQSLVDNKIAEGKTIEYKFSLPGNSDASKKEFLADVSSFANASGGDLIFGIKEKNGEAHELCGLININPDEEILRLENLVRDCIEPRMNISSRAIPLSNSRIAIIIRIRRSWALPHVVKFQKHWRFYSRNSRGKYPLDVQELRIAFAFSDTIAERLKNFRSERLAKIVAGETPIPLNDNPKIVLHIIPFGSFDPSSRFDISSLGKAQTFVLPICVNVPGLDIRYNFDGFLTYIPISKNGTSPAYLQLFHNGIIESVEASIIYNEFISKEYERLLNNSIERFLKFQKSLGVEPPIVIMLSLLGVFGTKIYVPSPFGIQKPHGIDRENLLIPEVMIESFDCKPAQVMKPIFDAIWNAAGWPRSLNYNENGEWALQ